MGVFGDNFMKYYEYGLVVLPCKDKKPVLGPEWQQYCNEKISEELAEKWEKYYRNEPQIGLAFGHASLFAAFDFDYEYDEKKCSISLNDFIKDKKMIERQLLAILPQTPVRKAAKKGWTNIYRVQETLENVQCDRNNTRLFDFLARNKQTILPPSKYLEGTDITYRWIGEPIEDCLDDIPFITQDIVDEIKLLFSDSSGGYDFEANGRHGRLLKWLLDIVKIEANDSKIVEKIIALDIATNPENPYFSDKKHFSRSKTPQCHALDWVKRVRKFVNVKGSKINIPVGSDGWDYFFEHSFYKIKKDIISKKCFFKLNESAEWGVMDDVEGVLKSYASKKRLQFTRTKDELERWTLEKETSDFLCDIPEWDGSDRITQFGMSIKSSEFSGEEISDILKHWGSNIFRRVKSADNQNRCIILKGPQGAGKDYFVRSMLKDFKPYYESTTMPGTQKDALEIVSRLLAVHIEEFDQTKSMDVAFLKSLITQPSAFFRESYGASPNQKIMRPSFISTANVDDILRDPTGNRRFIVIPVDSISWNYPRNDSMQVLAQMKHLFEKDEFECLDKDLEAKIKHIVSGYTPEDLSVSIVDLYSVKYDALISQNGPFPGSPFLTSKQVVSMLMDIARTAQCTLRKVQSSVKQNGLSCRTHDGIKYFKTKNDAIGRKNLAQNA